MNLADHRLKACLDIHGVFQAGFFIGFIQAVTVNSAWRMAMAVRRMPMAVRRLPVVQTAVVQTAVVQMA